MGRKETVCLWPRDAEGYYFRSLAKKKLFFKKSFFSIKRKLESIVRVYKRTPKALLKRRKI